MSSSSAKRIKLASSSLTDVFHQSRVRHSSDGLEFDETRMRVLNQAVGADDRRSGGVVYWMSRDSRVQDNWALIYAKRAADSKRVPLYVVFCLTNSFLDASLRQFHFLLEGLKVVQEECRLLDIAFVVLDGSGDLVLADWVREHHVSTVVCDFNPLRVVRGWVSSVTAQLRRQNVHFVQVDAHNVVPCWVASDKQEHNARTFRLKLRKHLPRYLTAFPLVAKHQTPPPPVFFERHQQVCWSRLLHSRKADAGVPPVPWAVAGYPSALKRFERFVHDLLPQYAKTRNDPTEKSQSNMSPWYHFGQISAQRVLYFLRDRAGDENVDAYVEECLVRRELADNFCYYNINYDSVMGAAEWAQRTLELHASDAKRVVYTLRQLDAAETHDDLWNAAQRELRLEGKMHGYMRMYWAKKILEWSPSADTALARAIRFNDRYGLDGRDPNGYVGCMWSVCGVHDQGWMERAVFGKIRYMNYEGCMRKFDVIGYIIANSLNKN
uniref:Deoxyribodipyrimidine photo-lyase n=1 Tax=Lymantria dispar multicapsid nuclear polyhedrosis virus TaxID=10449 RepID=A0A1B1MQQ9_NPVLD|nr:DNA photolyase [Lymantria dispar multiple nucleopolyhedrovirus]